MRFDMVEDLHCHGITVHEDLINLLKVERDLLLDCLQTVQVTACSLHVLHSGLLVFIFPSISVFVHKLQHVPFSAIRVKARTNGLCFSSFDG